MRFWGAAVFSVLQLSAAFSQGPSVGRDGLSFRDTLALQLPFLRVSESMGNHDSKIVDAGSVD